MFKKKEVVAPEATAGQEGVANVAPAAPVVKLTRTEKLLKRAELLKKRIEDDTAEYGDIANEINSAEAMKSLSIGSVVTIKLGRKFADRDTTRFVEATIVGIRDDEDNGVQYKVTYGTGFEADIAVVGAGAITAVKAAEGTPTPTA